MLFANKEIFHYQILYIQYFICFISFEKLLFSIKIVIYLERNKDQN